MSSKNLPDPLDTTRSPVPSHPLATVNVKFTGAVLVCGDCEDRGDGPRKLCARDARKALKREIASHKAGKDARFKLRIVQCSCLGLCPKKAMALVAVRSGSDAPLAAEVKTIDDVNAFGRRSVAAEGAVFCSP